MKAKRFEKFKKMEVKLWIFSEHASGRDSRGSRYREEEIIHKGVDRVDAERQLADQDTGTFLIRVRDNGTLALSIKASKGVLHIKLEVHSFHLNKIRETISSNEY